MQEVVIFIKRSLEDERTIVSSTVLIFVSRDNAHRDPQRAYEYLQQYSNILHYGR